MNYEYELIRHSDNALFNLFITEINTRSIHFHSDFEIAMILSPAQLEIFCKGNYHTYFKNEMYVLNPLDIHGVPTPPSENLFLLVLQLNPKIFRDVFPDRNELRFKTFFMNDITNEQYRELKDLFIKFAHAYFEECVSVDRIAPFKYTSLFYLFIHRLLDCKPHDFYSDSESMRLRQVSNRLTRIVKYIEANYMFKPSLSELSEKEGLSQSYLSHFILDNLGYSFQDYVTIVRLDHAKTLIQHGKRFSDASVESGFSDPRYMTKAFLKHMGCTPAQFQKRFSGITTKGAIYKTTERFLSSAESLEIICTIPTDPIFV